MSGVSSRVISSFVDDGEETGDDDDAGAGGGSLPGSGGGGGKSSFFGKGGGGGASRTTGGDSDQPLSTIETRTSLGSRGRSAMVLSYHEPVKRLMASPKRGAR